MKNFETNWTRSEFKAYLLSYAANANYFESEEEKDVICSKISVKEYDQIHKELAKDNDYQSIQKILYTLEKYKYDKDDLENLIQDIKKLFYADDEFDVLEENMLYALKKILK